jgi:hypothetical protein
MDKQDTQDFYFITYTISISYIKKIRKQKGCGYGRGCFKPYVKSYWKVLKFIFR